MARTLEIIALEEADTVDYCVSLLGRDIPKILGNGHRSHQCVTNDPAAVDVRIIVDGYPPKSR